MGSKVASTSSSFHGRYIDIVSSPCRYGSCTSLLNGPRSFSSSPWVHLIAVCCGDLLCNFIILLIFFTKCLQCTRIHINIPGVVGKLLFDKTLSMISSYQMVIHTICFPLCSAR